MIVSGWWCCCREWYVMRRTWNCSVKNSGRRTASSRVIRPLKVKSSFPNDWRNDWLSWYLVSPLVVCGFTVYSYFVCGFAIITFSWTFRYILQHISFLEFVLVMVIEPNWTASNRFTTRTEENLWSWRTRTEQNPVVWDLKNWSNWSNATNLND